MSPQFLGFDHIDTRVVSVKAVEPFYDRLMPMLGLAHKRYCHVAPNGDWHDASDTRPYNAVEYYNEVPVGQLTSFIGFIEEKDMRPSGTRIAFQVQSPFDAKRWQRVLSDMGAANVELSASADYPAVFFEDPCGTKLEVCARKPSAS